MKSIIKFFTTISIFKISLPFIMIIIFGLINNNTYYDNIWNTISYYGMVFNVICLIIIFLIMLFYGIRGTIWKK